jgi:chromate transporter
VERSRGDLRISAPLAAITAALVGVIASLAVFFAGPVLWAGGGLQPLPLAVLLLALVALLRWRWGVLPLIGAAVLLGVVRQLLGWP